MYNVSRVQVLEFDFIAKAFKSGFQTSAEQLLHVHVQLYGGLEGSNTNKKETANKKKENANKK